ncbi:hypothetical protein ABZ599_16600 [Streptomyces misionensis]|uniref:hypothetical protein n=1 Tax=Streptomyces misionensis TaxID=67331 RepID=UPI0033CF63D4
MTPYERLMAEAIPTGSFGDPVSEARREQALMTTEERQAACRAAWSRRNPTGVCRMQPPNASAGGLLRTAVDGNGKPYVWVEAANLACGGDQVAMWLTIEQVVELGAALNTVNEYRATDHTGHNVSVTPGATWTTFTVTRQANDYEESAAMRVVVLTGRLPELRDALATTAQFAQQRIAAGTREPLTPAEHDRAWRANEGATGELGADPSTILWAVLGALQILPPSAKDWQAALEAVPPCGLHAVRW